MSIKIFITLLLPTILFVGCKNESVPIKNVPKDESILHANQNQLTKVMIHDVFSPSVSSRIYSYTSLAAYEAVKHNQPQYNSITDQLNGFKKMPEPESGSNINYLLAASKAFFSVAEKLVFSVDSMKVYQEELYADFKDEMEEQAFIASMNFGDSIASVVLARAATDNYKQTRGMPKFIGSQEAGKWRPTSPDYMDAVEPYCNLITPLALDSASQFKPARPPVFARDSTSEFYKHAYEVFQVNQNLTDSQKLIAHYWDDNAFVMEHSGHLMFANKKITPAGHWMGIAGIACKKAKADPVKTALTYSLVAISLFDGFISCWDEKYRSQVIRPISVINDWINPTWSPLLQTPSFPEYPSGHSTISSAASIVLTNLFGDNFAFHDDSDKQYIGMERSFHSFYEAAKEASISRLYGGIHYRFGIDAGIKQGTQVGEYLVKKLQFKDSTSQIANK